ncbi:hypothetical protein [Agromyces cerinus]|uniref:Uncharacterized protein n=1 Tax=Agromyces cerinus subsp. cerinus TaxID=232089 RepID=A0A1N6DXH8_9MICO|nr:hypothetical protein [Agromyces cerinus]SIN75433.1 hypothetical protein SAMN05443544_0848 [Agromyces cerinus subsp. cerinus]
MSDAYTRPTDDRAAGTPVLPNFAPALDDEPSSAPAQKEPAERGKWSGDLRFMLVVLAAIVALFLAFALLIAFSPTGPAISALAIIAAPIATMVAAYYGISLALRQVKDARNAAEASEARARAAEQTARESDAWAAQMESGLRVAVAKLKAGAQDTRDVERAAGTPDDFF